MQVDSRYCSSSSSCCWDTLDWQCDGIQYFCCEAFYTADEKIQHVRYINKGMEWRLCKPGGIVTSTRWLNTSDDGTWVLLRSTQQAMVCYNKPVFLILVRYPYPFSGFTPSKRGAIQDNTHKIRWKQKSNTKNTPENYCHVKRSQKRQTPVGLVVKPIFFSARTHTQTHTDTHTDTHRHKTHPTVHNGIQYQSYPITLLGHCRKEWTTVRSRIFKTGCRTIQWCRDPSKLLCPALSFGSGRKCGLDDQSNVFKSCG